MSAQLVSSRCVFTGLGWNGLNSSSEPGSVPCFISLWRSLQIPGFSLVPLFGGSQSSGFAALAEQPRSFCSAELPSLPAGQGWRIPGGLGMAAGAAAGRAAGLRGSAGGTAAPLGLAGPLGAAGGSEGSETRLGTRRALHTGTGNWKDSKFV